MCAGESRPHSIIAQTSHPSIPSQSLKNVLIWCFAAKRIIAIDSAIWNWSSGNNISHQVSTPHGTTHTECRCRSIRPVIALELVDRRLNRLKRTTRVKWGAFGRNTPTLAGGPAGHAGRDRNHIAEDEQTKKKKCKKNHTHVVVVVDVLTGAAKKRVNLCTFYHHSHGDNKYEMIKYKLRQNAWRKTLFANLWRERPGIRGQTFAYLPFSSFILLYLLMYLTLIRRQVLRFVLLCTQ